MAGKLSFNIELTGAEKAATRLAALEKAAHGMGFSLSAEQLGALDAALKKLGATIQSNPGLVRSLLRGGSIGGLGGGASPLGTKAVPPVIAPPIIQPNVVKQSMAAMLAQLAATLALGGRHPYLAMGSLVSMAKGAGIAGATGIVAALGGPVAAVIDALGLLKTVSFALSFAFHGLKNAIEEGARLYQRSAKTAKSPERLFQIESMAAATGMTPEAVEMLLLRGEHPLRGRGGAMLNVGGDRFGSGRGVMQTGGLQQLGNMGEYLRRANLSVSMVDTMAMGQAAKPLQEIFFQVGNAARELHVAFAQIATLMAPTLLFALQSFTMYMQMFNVLMAPLIGILQLLGQIPRGLPGNTVIPTGGTRPSFSAWERMGLIVGGGIGGNDYARQTAMNTKRIADHITGQRGVIGFNAGGLALFNLP